MDKNTYYLFFFILVISIWIFTYFYEKNRREILEYIATHLGFSFSKIGREHTQSQHANFELFSQGRRKKIINEMWGTHDDNQISIFGYRYTVGSGKSSTTFNQTVISIKCDKFCTPHFELKPENIFHKIGQVFGSEDIDFDAFPDFSKKYLLKGKNEVKIRELFTSEVISFFEWNLGLCVEAQGNILIVYKQNIRCKPDDIRDFLKNGKTVHSKLFSSQSRLARY